VRTLRVGGLLWLGVAAACHDTTATQTQSPGTPPPPIPALPYLGADISALARIEQGGGVFRDSGHVRDAIAILKSHGANTFRLRIFVNPNDSDVQVNDLPYTLALAGRVKAAGAKLLLDFHYSDTWADPGHQTTPAAWAALGYDSLAAQVERYTAGVVAQLKHAGALPDIVQVGNEIDAGMLWPIGQLTGTVDSLTQWTQFTGLLKAAIQGVRDSLAPSDSVRIMLQYSLGGNQGGTQWFFDHVLARGVSFDLVGLSYYPFWHGTLTSLEQNLNATAARYGKPVVVVETAYPWRAGGWEGMVTDPGAMAWSATRDGQAKFLSDLGHAVAAVPANQGAGLFWWYPEAIPVNGLFVFAGGSLALFDSTGNALPAIPDFGQ
jgi:arabinogalactan endo-1,4-beta-galactosidase